MDHAAFHPPGSRICPTVGTPGRSDDCIILECGVTDCADLECFPRVLLESVRRADISLPDYGWDCGCSLHSVLPSYILLFQQYETTVVWNRVSIANKASLSVQVMFVRRLGIVSYLSILLIDQQAQILGLKTTEIGYYMIDVGKYLCIIMFWYRIQIVKFNHKHATPINQSTHNQLNLDTS